MLAALRDALDGVLPAGVEAEWREGMRAPPLPSLPQTPPVEPFLDRWGIERGPDAAFWTEAAIYGAAGIPAFVLGPGDIAQAHQADEFVELGQLEAAVAAISRIISAQPPEGAHVP